MEFIFEAFHTFMETFSMERMKFNLNPDELKLTIIRLSPTLSDDYDQAYKRCAYMYRYATCHFKFFKECMINFFSEYKYSKTLIKEWRPKSDLCSLSFGPGLDFLAFTVAILECQPKAPVPVFQNVNIISQHGAWRNTVNLLSEVIQKAKTSQKIDKNIKFSGINVLQNRIFCSFREDAIPTLVNSDVVLMFKLLNLTALLGQEDFRKTVKKLVYNIKPGATVFFIDTYPSCCMMKEVLREFDGTYLHGPVPMDHIIPDEFPEDYLEVMGEYPIKSAKGMFFVWKKSISVRTEFQKDLPMKFNSLEKGQIPSVINCTYNNEQSSRISFDQPINLLHQVNLSSTIKNKGLSSSFASKKENDSKNVLSRATDKNLDYSRSDTSTSSITSSLECQEISLDFASEKDTKSMIKNNISKSAMESKFIQTDPIVNMPNYQLSTLELLTDKIKYLTNSVENNFVLQNQMTRNENTIGTMVADKLDTIDQLTERINRMISSLESGLGNQTLNINSFVLPNQMTGNENTIGTMVTDKLNTIVQLTQRINRLIISLESGLGNQTLNINCEDMCDNFCIDLDDSR